MQVLGIISVLNFMVYVQCHCRNCALCAQAERRVMVGVLNLTAL